MKFNCEIKAKYNYKRIDNIIKELSLIPSEITHNILDNLRGYAIRLEKGHNEDGILCEMVNTSKNTVKGRVYAKPEEFKTDDGKSYLWFEYFGTGKFAEKEHIGTTPHFVESSYTEWLIPIDKVGRKLNYLIVNIKGKQFYLAHGNKANHFLGDAEFESRNENIKIAKNNLEEMIKEVCK